MQQYAIYFLDKHLIKLNDFSFANKSRSKICKSMYSVRGLFSFLSLSVITKFLRVSHKSGRQLREIKSFCIKFFLYSYYGALKE